MLIVSISNIVISHLLSIDNLKSLFHLATFVAPALLICYQRDVGMLWDALLTVTAVNTVAVLLITKVVIATQQKDRSIDVALSTQAMLKVA